ncbi:unnamed protein product [Gongylonema pulchrum]|uniref:TonB-dependent receptor n=1 Tax=Gongylonema pulchrum TaxID=637853 RepID=A0A183E8I2_9BILA|nr:unnamed protein product [Gongylonema pulchrum]
MAGAAVRELRAVIRRDGSKVDNVYTGNQAMANKFIFSGFSNENASLTGNEPSFQVLAKACVINVSRTTAV